MGLPTTLVCVGARPPRARPLPECVEVMGTLAKRRRKDREKLMRLYAGAHFLLLPTLADIAPAALREASCFAVPSITTDVGGIGSVVRDGVNGQKFPLSASVDDYCTYVEHLMRDRGSYQQLALSSFHEYRSHLDWSLAGRRLRETISAVL